MDNFSRGIPIHAGKIVKGGDVVRIMEALRVPDKRLPVRIQTDNGNEFISKVWINGRMSLQRHNGSRAPESRQITRLLNHLTAVCGMNT